MVVAKVDAYEIIGSEEVMFDSEKRFVSTRVETKSCELLTLKRSDLKNLLYSNSKKVVKTQGQNLGQVTGSDTLEEKLQILSYTKLKSLSKKVSNLKEVTENLGNQNKRKHVLVDEKSFEEVKFKIDREYEKVFLKQMTKMKIIRQPRAMKEVNKKYPVTSFYNQLIKDNSRTELSKRINQGKIIIQKP